MFRIPALESICDPAKERAKRLGSLRQSIRGGEGNYVGYILQIAWHRIFGGEDVDSYDYDVMMPENWLAHLPDHSGKIDLKSKERTLSHVDPSWEVSVADHAGRGRHQNCDAYSFGSISVDRNKKPVWIWFLGGISKEKYFKGRLADTPQDTVETDSKGRVLIRFEGLKDGAEFRQKGLSYDDNGFKCSEDCWNRRIDYLDCYKLTDLSKSGKNELYKIIQESKTQGWGGSLDHLLGKQTKQPSANSSTIA